jgi:hypothetical protein
MTKQFLLFFIFVSFISAANAQITKGNWLVGGTGYFTSASYSGTTAASYKQTIIQISPNIGYFFIDKLSIGLKPGYSYNKTNLGTTPTSSSTFSVGPFARYYLLNIKNQVNIFSEVNYQFNKTTTTDNQSFSYNQFSVSAGPVIFFNSSVGLELSIGYTRGKYGSDATSMDNTLRVGVGFQIHLDRER